MEIWTAFILGCAGSLHCAGMCGPLTLALPSVATARMSLLWARLTYNFGRILTYCFLGFLFGLLGKSFALAGLQRWVSILAGVMILLGLLASLQHTMTAAALKLVALLKSGFARLLQKRNLSSLFLLGTLNGFLPCGLVYAACAGSVATGNISSSLEYMLAFGLGTVPMMLGIGMAGTPVRFAFRLKLQKVTPLFLALLGAILILRGLSLGIPYLSPALSNSSPAKNCCH